MPGSFVQRGEKMWIDVTLIGVLIICFITDVREQKIYNKVIFPSLAAAVVMQTLYYGLQGLKVSIIGFAVGLCILMVPYLLGGMGAGDVKLLSLIGALKGGIFVLNTAIYMALIGGIIAFAIIIFHKQTICFFKKLGSWLISLCYGIKTKLEFPTSPFIKKYPYGIAISAGALICLLFKGAWII